MPVKYKLDNLIYTVDEDNEMEKERLEGLGAVLFEEEREKELEKKNKKEGK